MKKLLSFVMAAIMTVSVFALSVVPAMAADTVKSPTGTTVVNSGAVLMVNGVVSNNSFSFSTAEKDGALVVTYSYTDKGTLTGWETNLTNAVGSVDGLGLVAGVDYTITNNADGSLTIAYISDAAKAAYDNGEVVVNALVDFGNGVTAATPATKPNDSSKAPATGMSASVVAGSVAVACAGIAVLAATKKRDAE